MADPVDRRAGGDIVAQGAAIARQEGAMPAGGERDMKAQFEDGT